MFYPECGTPMYVSKEDSNPSIRMICDGVQNKDLFMSLKNLLDAREEEDAPAPVAAGEEDAVVGSDQPAVGGDQVAQRPAASSSESCHRSIYREMMFVTLKSFGQDNIDLTAFDREYRRAFDKLPAKYQTLLTPADRPPNAVTVLCRKFFRELKI